MIEYRLSSEELKKYENIKGSGKKPIILERGLEDMKETKITKEQLVEECRNLGFSKEAYEKIAEKYGLDVKGVSKRVSVYRIRKLIEQEAAATVKQAVEEERKLETRKVKFYISTGYDNKDKAAKLAEVIKAAGEEITYAWWELEYTEDINELARRGEAEIQGVRDADVVIVMMPGRFGTHAELGAALALGKRILLYGTGGFGAMPFYHCGGVRQVVGSDMDLVCEVLRLKSWA